MCVYVCVCVCVYVCMCVCVYVCICISMCMYMYVYGRVDGIKDTYVVCKYAKKTIT
jgi:hypothetical protein